jgi:hypothetical protein
MDHHESSSQRLLSLLGQIAMYNDKGHIWSKHAPERVAEEQAKAQREILELITEVGEHCFPDGLLLELKAGAASRDSSGSIRHQVAHCLGLI